ncbi:hypothetical protein M0804_008982 [Polistes exclamans]|nr:hypothetical protein M0804_008982 [Polistes exclamans]
MVKENEKEKDRKKEKERTMRYTGWTYAEEETVKCFEGSSKKKERQKKNMIERGKGHKGKEIKKEKAKVKAGSCVERLYRTMCCLLR